MLRYLTLLQLNILINQRVAEEEGWETARDTLQDQTKETLDAWKDELNNLLIFVRFAVCPFLLALSYSEGRRVCSLRS